MEIYLYWALNWIILNKYVLALSNNYNLEDS